MRAGTTLKPLPHTNSSVQRLHGGEQQHIADGRRVGHEHDHAVDAVADAARGGHADIQSIEEVLIGVVGLFVALLELFFLSSEAFALVDGVVELGVGIGHLPAVHEELKALHIFGVGGLLLDPHSIANQHIQRKLA